MQPTEHQRQKIVACLEMDKHLSDFGEFWLAEFKPDEALLFAQESQVYNRLTRKGIVGLIEYINKKCPDALSYKIGNECSRVVYAIFQVGFQPKLFHEVETYAREKANCDEVTVTPSKFGSYEIRMWWD